ncbi:MAG TPA: hypothetical protein VHE12_04175 [bacterium]|nr:hypothetical protein [bacterium]
MRQERPFKTPGRSLSVPFHPPFYFLLFLTANLLLSFGSWDLTSKLWIFAFGILVPSVTGIHAVLRQKSSFLADDRDKGRRSFLPLYWILFLLGLVFTRFFRLEGLPYLPISDEGTFSYLALGLKEHWKWNLLWAEARMEPLLIWALGLYYRLVEPSLWALRVFPALVSIAVALMAYGAARTRFSSRFSMIFAWILAFSFWEFSLMRLSTPNDFIPLFQLAGFGLWGLYVKTAKGPRKIFFLLALGLWGGMGFFVYTNWLPIWSFFLLILVFAQWKERRMSLMPVFPVLALPFAVPLLLARLAPGGMSLIRNDFGNWFSLRSYAFYLNGIFWDGSSSFPLGPLKGGMLDPITGALVLVGVIQVIGSPTRKWALGLGVGFFLALQPGVVTNSLELQRITPAFPFLALAATFGVQSLVGYWSRAPRWAPLLLLIPILIMNSFSFFGSYCDPQAGPAHVWRPISHWDAYKTLEAQRERTGPLYIFTEFNTDYDNKVLSLAVHPFNLLDRRDPQPGEWASMVVNSEYLPYFIVRFPGLRFRQLAVDTVPGSERRPICLILVRAQEIGRGTLASWISAERTFDGIDRAIKDKRSTDLWESFLESRPDVRKQCQEDRFLTAVYWEKLAFLKFLDSHFMEATEAYRNAIQLGVPAGHLYYDLGFCLKLQGRKAEADACFRKAEMMSSRAQKIIEQGAGKWE